MCFDEARDEPRYGDRRLADVEDLVDDPTKSTST
jgi:hypothetical protein